MTNLEFSNYIELLIQTDRKYHTLSSGWLVIKGSSAGRLEAILQNFKKVFRNKEFMGTTSDINAIIAVCLKDSYWLIFDSNIGPALQEHYFKGLQCK